MSVVRVQAFAKVNLSLLVLYRRADSFHELRTVFQTVSLADRLEIEYRPGGSAAIDLTCSDTALETRANLAFRAARALLSATGSRGRVRIRLEKRIPAAAGLGGGSSDAAATLLALSSLLPRRPSRHLLFRLAGELGSDVPFFLIGGRALGVGRGTEIYPLPDLPRFPLLIVAPRIAVATAGAYRALSPGLTSQTWEGKIDRFCSGICAPAQGLAPRPENAVNDFEPVVFRMHPELKRLQARLKRLGARIALLCGSGSALFGIFRDRKQALHARDSLDPEDGRAFVVRSVGRSEYGSRWRTWLNGRLPGD